MVSTSQIANNGSHSLDSGLNSSLVLYTFFNWKKKCKTQRCQVSRIIGETSEFGPYLPGLQIRVWNLPYNHCSKFLNILHCLSYILYFTVNIERFLINSSMVYYAIAIYPIIWLVGSKPVRYRKFMTIGVNKYFALTPFPYRFSIFEDLVGWQRWKLTPQKVVLLVFWIDCP